ncbi:LOW QUALITY PROTEIN: microtubule-associated protein 9 [Ammospiza nelsoni]|uniref:LOW QUALITY PROTEIN: microtubule-associated protein 9 n=1 Tax=Ammospiza nelsoni TaxID=2857394 RepID=UPI00286BA99D|nr:LOW QUALITY PROTEIN: microtubule-associated protein 9 [Ammospiza nelsoni]
MYGCTPCGNGVICRIGTSIINPGRTRASIINPGRTRASIIHPGSAALARLRKWRCRDVRRFPTNEGDRRRGRCRATAGPAGPGPRLFPGAPSRGSFPGLLPGDTAAAAGAAKRQRDASAMAGAGTADSGLQLFVKPFQDGLQEAISDHATSKEKDEYPDDFESDEDGMLNDIGEERAESNSGSTSTERSLAGSPLLNDDALQKVVDLENEAPDDLNLSFHEKKLQQIMVLEGEPIQNDRKDGKEGCLEGQNEDNRKNNEEVLRDNSESDDLPINKLHEKRNQEENQPKAKPQMRKKRNASAPEKDQKTVNTSDLKLEDNGMKSPSVDSSDGMMKITEERKIADAMQEVSVNDQSEHGEAKNTSKNSVKKLSETKERVENPKPSLSDRSTTSVHLKRKGKAVPSTSPVSSQYLGSLKMLEDKCMQKTSPEFNKVDNLRAAVYQNWLERKKLLLLELKRSEKEKAEILRNNTEKKEALKREESIACYEAWKKKKEKEARKLSERKKREELEEKKPAEQNKEKTEAAQAAFKKWKERKVEYLREQNKKEKQSERMRKKIEEDLVAEKRRVSVLAVEKWNEKKKECIKKKKVEKFLEKKKREMQQAKKEEKSEKAMEEYERWLENKMRREQLEKSQKKFQAVHGNEMSPPWRPPGKVTYSSNY